MFRADAFKATRGSNMALGRTSRNVIATRFPMTITGRAYRKQTRLLLAALLMSCLGGCALPPYNPPPPGILVTPPAIPASEPFARAYIFRDDSFTGSANHRWVSLNKEVVATLLTKERIELLLRPGRHEITVHCFAWGKWREQSRTIEATADQSYFLLLSASLSESVRVDELSAEQAEAWAQKTEKVAVGPR
jgi:hypothetical protein